MGTSCIIYVELDHSKYIGTYCHYDGYTEHMIPALDSVVYNLVYGEILKAGMKGGFRAFSPLDGSIEYLEDSIQCYAYSPENDFRTYGAEYVYIKCADNTIKYRATYERYSQGGRWFWHTPNTPLALTSSEGGMSL